MRANKWRYKLVVQTCSGNIENIWLWLSEASQPSKCTDAVVLSSRFSSRNLRVDLCEFLKLAVCCRAIEICLQSGEINYRKNIMIGSPFPGSQHNMPCINVSSTGHCRELSWKFAVHSWCSPLILKSFTLLNWDSIAFSDTRGTSRCLTPHARSLRATHDHWQVDFSTAYSNCCVLESTMWPKDPPECYVLWSNDADVHLWICIHVHALALSERLQRLHECKKQSDAGAWLILIAGSPCPPWWVSY